MLELQELIFEKKISRSELYNYKNNSTDKFKISVYRNHSFELIEHTINLYLDYANINAKFIYSDYDDSLSFLNIDLTSDLIIVWIDFTRYNFENVDNFIKERLDYLSSVYKKQILFIPFGSFLKIEKTNVITYSLSEIQKKLENKYTDLRLEPFSGTKLSSKAQMEISKNLGLKYIPACIINPIKAIIFDLDNTLYKGVLGEDGYKNIELTESHKNLQEKIVELSKQGFFICIASKNEEKDVIEMFNKRTDFPLKLDNITKLCASWNSKAESVLEIQKFLNIGIKDMLFVDDNMGEIASVKSKHHEINVILAKDDADLTLNILNNYPRMLKLNINYEDLIRKQDTQANEQREKLKNSLSKEDFLKALEMQLTYGINKKTQIKRISELSNKTNQFICTYKRYSEVEVEQMMKDNNYMIITVSLKDKLSDSGIIGVMVFKNKIDFIDIEETFISCRALGRGIDKNIIFYPIDLAIKYFGKNKIKFNFIKGERNKPAENFIDKNLIQYKNLISSFNEKLDCSLVTVKIEEGNRWKNEY